LPKRVVPREKPLVPSGMRRFFCCYGRTEGSFIAVGDQSTYLR